VPGLASASIDKTRLLDCTIEELIFTANEWLAKLSLSGTFYFAYGVAVGLPGVRFLTGQSGFLAICPVKNMMLNWTISCPVFWPTLKTARNLVS